MMNIKRFGKIVIIGIILAIGVIVVAGGGDMAKAQYPPPIQLR